MLNKNEFLIRPMNESDYVLIAKWLSDEKVLEYYGPRLTLEQVITKYGPRIEGNHSVKPYIVEYKNTPIGYMQYYPILDTQLRAYGYLEQQHIFGIDQFIGEINLWGKGIGSTMISMLLEYISLKESVQLVILDVKNTNVRAIKCYEKCGFRTVGSLENNYSLMEWTPSLFCDLIEKNVTV
ncbi:GNAT family N-acetyltransferase [Psychrobacillus sp. NPDC058041]|uniref:GNAT family N-acetyltransferase n=1 Tax=Psychrobacillus sp. NPDC058041 TaxID=3346310 RepID=UPI0036D7979E